MASVRIADLTIPNDETLIPSLRNERYLVSEYAQAMRLYGSWGEFPEGIIDQDGLVLDGVHRVLAAQEAGITQGKMRRVHCDTAAERLRIAAASNAKQGQRWSNKQIANLALVAERVGLPVEDLASDLGVPPEKIMRIPMVGVVRITQEGPAERKVYAKKAARPGLRERVLSEEEAEIMRQITTPNPADKILLDLIRLHQLDALPELNPDSYRNVLAVQQILTEWEARDQHILEAV
jgi:hypothetical protein